MFVEHRFQLDSGTIDEIQSMVPRFGYNGFGELVFYRTYSRNINGRQETWNDCVIRVIEGVMSIRYDWYLKNRIEWDRDFWQHYARHMALYMFQMKWLPPGRGLWAMGTDFVYNRGGMALQNCGFKIVTDDIGKDVHWIMDALMCGVGVGFNPTRSENLIIREPQSVEPYTIPDDREGWCESVKMLIDSYIYRNLPKPIFDYSVIRPTGMLIKGFGGLSSGPGPLKYFHQQIELFMDMYMNTPWYSSVMLKADIVNAAGCCVVSGNVRRSAELLAGEIDDIIDLKNYDKYSYRESHGGMSNNSVYLRESEDFERLGEIAERIKSNGEPGFINLCNLPFGRIGKDMFGLKPDPAVGFNPCGEQPLEDAEICTLVETCPTLCDDVNDWLRACEFATMYASTVTLLPTHRPETNRVAVKNRRIGVGIIDVVKWKENIGTSKLIKNLREGYNRIRSVNSWANNEAGVPIAIRVTTIKPGGTTPKLPGLRSGWSWPTFGYTKRRIRIAQNQPIHAVLTAAGIPYEADYVSVGTDCFEFPIDQSDGGNIKPATEVSVWEQAMMLVLLQREWSDNAVSNTLYFRPKWALTRVINLGESIYHIPNNDYYEAIRLIAEYTGMKWDEFINSQEFENKNYRVKLTQNKWTYNWEIHLYKYDPTHEEDSIEAVLAAIAPLTKSVSMLPHSPKGVYLQSPEEELSEEEYNHRLSMIKPIDWSTYVGGDGMDEKYCTGEVCESKGS